MHWVWTVQKLCPILIRFSAPREPIVHMIHLRYIFGNVSRASAETEAIALQGAVAEYRRGSIDSHALWPGIIWICRAFCE